ncbi:uncharacterized protein TRIADDRAFT_58892 [Trichoplax adhaerens]|uniref:TLC domain-containing protein n=1 Tax=Trichoplax adhaerens TaxID=10228 RepID=B3S3Y8_TRIAD|nr:hypothetical protein TRIADDRAFT_58892 [Trichoplax adhaerens]EDV22553.1 hypothetical protein TRIADDRAFT_58892 [Trichoplax adhaerens]|eukprot:XP_002115097.1 hypothetical protein TRIADDRAFT_58892 [Trichoplax adhaerens]
MSASAPYVGYARRTSRAGSRYISSICWSYYSRLTFYQQVEWDTRIYSNIHAVIVIICCGTIALGDQAGGIAPYISALRMLSEASTPFVNQRWFLDACKYERGTSIYVINGLLMTASFFLSRLCLAPIQYHVIYHYWQTGVLNAMTSLEVFALIILPAIADVLNCYWFYKMLRGAFKIVTSLFKDNTAKKLKD